MTDKLVKQQDAYAIARSLAEGVERQVQSIVHDVEVEQQLSPVEMQQLIIRITGALENIAQSQQKIMRMLEAQGAHNFYR